MGAKIREVEIQGIPEAKNGSKQYNYISYKFSGYQCSCIHLERQFEGNIEQFTTVPTELSSKQYTSDTAL